MIFARSVKAPGGGAESASGMSLPSGRTTRPRPAAVLLALVAVALLAALAPAARAAGTPDIALQYDAPTAVLFGEDASVTLRATNPAGQRYGYNLSFRVVLPAGVSYVPGSAPVAPQQIADTPGAGETTLIFEQRLRPQPELVVRAQLPGPPRRRRASRSARATSTTRAPTSTTTRASCPTSRRTAAPVGDFTGFATASATTQINAIEIEKDEPSPEGELLRGVARPPDRLHAHRPQQQRRADDEPAGGGLAAGGARVPRLRHGRQHDRRADQPARLAGGVRRLGAAEPGPRAGRARLRRAEPRRDRARRSRRRAVRCRARSTRTSSGAASGALRREGRSDCSTSPPCRCARTRLRGSAACRRRRRAASRGRTSTTTPGPETQDEQALTNYATATGSYDGTLARQRRRHAHPHRRGRAHPEVGRPRHDQPGPDQQMVAADRHLRVPLRRRRRRDRHAARRPLPARPPRLRGRLRRQRPSATRPATSRPPPTRPRSSRPTAAT